MAAERGEIDRDLQAVTVGAGVLLAQARDPHEGIRVANDALDHVHDDFVDAVDLEGAAEATAATGKVSAAQVTDVAEAVRVWGRRPDAALWFALAWVEGIRPE